MTGQGAVATAALDGDGGQQPRPQIGAAAWPERGHNRPAPTDSQLDWGPYLPWATPLVLLAQGRVEDARAALAATPEPPRDHLQEALWCLTAHAPARLDEPEIAALAAVVLRHARAEHAGAASGMLTLGPVERYLTEAEACATADQ